MTGYYHAKRTALAKQYLATREAQDHITARNFELEVSRAWLDDYHRRPHPSRFNWAPRWPFTPSPIQPLTPKDTSNAEGQEIIEGEYTVVADHAAAGDRAGEVGKRIETGQKHTSQGETTQGRRRPTRTGEFETPF